MKSSTISIHDILKQNKCQGHSSFPSNEDDIEIFDDNKENTIIAVDIDSVDVEAIEIMSINDEHGRISDIIESLEGETGLSVIPLKMADVLPEVCSLSRHKLFTFEGERYAMSYQIRNNVVQQFCERIIKALSSGVPFSEVINSTVYYNGKEFPTLALSENEWTTILAKFRNYRQKLYVSDGNLIMEILGERV